LSKRNVKLILKVLSDLEPLRGSSNKKTLYSTRSCVNWAFFSTRVPLKRSFHSRFKMAHSCQKRPNLHTNSSHKLLLICELVVLIWPSKSPDLNPIENLWGQMVFNWNNPPERVRFRTVAELDENVTRVWENMRGRDYCQNMVDGMRQRLQECIDNRGYYTHY
jgi:hypothetical protein